MNLDLLCSPFEFLQSVSSHVATYDWLKLYQTWWQQQGQGISDGVDRAGTVGLRMFDRFGARVDEICYSPEYWKMLRRGYSDGILWRAFEQNSLLPAFLGIYVTSFFDPGLACPYTVSLGTAAPFSKYGDAELVQALLPRLLVKDETVWQGATWMTEIKGGSDLGATVETVAVKHGTGWHLNGDKYFASNAGAELAVVGARPEGAPKNVRGLALFLVPRYRRDGKLNYFIRRLKDKIATRSVPTGEIELRDSEAWLLGEAQAGIYLILEVLNLSRVANSMGSVALAQRAIADALSFAQQRMVFGKPLAEQPLATRQFDERVQKLRAGAKLAWLAVTLADEVWREKPPYSDRYHLFRLVTHLAKYWTAELAVDAAKWGMEIHAGIGTLAEFRAERWLREAMILDIWEGPPHRQILDGLEVIDRKKAHRLLFDLLSASAPVPGLKEMESRIEQHLEMPSEEREAKAEQLFASLASFTADV